jgi:hypothetical protein
LIFLKVSNVICIHLRGRRRLMVVHQSMYAFCSAQRQTTALIVLLWFILYDKEAVREQWYLSIDSVGVSWSSCFARLWLHHSRHLPSLWWYSNNVTTYDNPDYMQRSSTKVQTTHLTLIA